ncbi:MAG: DCC1-like thiol-disulfide oxidoreductase family protein [Nitrospira sp.]|nr:DCC1-like thiol-disulfide oxidoreductase family protein [Nitrospira sp.]MDH4304149.1 DCC1-like thiol-disulfide oxidoreductase family protein [Nitrospira sp.]MDH5194781.1 DCC1-like thiol-disulfide oxidoreductase family protein [Nitrospira sp.]
MIYQLDTSVHEWAKYERLILFDGVCNWCNAWVNVAIAHDPDQQFKFGTLQSEQAQHILRDLQLSATDYQTFLLLEGGRVYTKSTAALRVIRQLSWWWPLFYVGVLVPVPLRDVVYDFVARHRYQWMGRAATCRVPTQVERDRFV